MLKLRIASREKGLDSGASFVSKLATNSGLTQIRLRSRPGSFGVKLDDNNDTIANILSLYNGNPSTSSGQAAPAASQPYYVP
ncbi:MAG: hypothetical protein WA821_02515 [Anaerolineales bacterium]